LALGDGEEFYTLPIVVLISNYKCGKGAQTPVAWVFTGTIEVDGRRERIKEQIFVNFGMDEMPARRTGEFCTCLI